MHRFTFLLALFLSCSLFAEAKAPKVTKLVDGFKFVESPVLDESTGRIYFSDTQDDKAYWWHPTDGLKAWRHPAGKPNGNRITKDGILYSCEHWGRQVSMTNLTTGKTETLVNNYEGKKLNSPNDLTFKSDGTLWFSDPPWGLEGRDQELPGNHIFAIDPTKKKLHLVAKLDKPNGIAFSPDEKWLYLGNKTKLWRYPVTGKFKIGKPEQVGDIKRVDGFRINSKGNIFGAIRNPATEYGIHIWTADGKLIQKIKLPEPTTNLCLVDDGKILYVSTITSLYKIER